MLKNQECYRLQDLKLVVYFAAIKMNRNDIRNMAFLIMVGRITNDKASIACDNDSVMTFGDIFWSFLFIFDLL